MSQDMTSQTTFETLGLTSGVIRALTEAGLSTPTEIQTRAIPAILRGQDVIGRSHTGTGKTLAFGIPAVEHCLKHPDCSSPQVLVLCPTRELAMQVCDEIRRMTRFVEGVRTVCVYGGQPIQNQIPQLRRGADIVIGTPGRVIDHIHRKTLRMEQLGMVILDEADEMLDMGFREDIECILTFAPAPHQTLLFSATMPQEILDIANQFQTNPLTIETAADHVRTIDTVQQYYYEVPLGGKSDALGLLLHVHEPQRCIIFCNTKKMVEELNRYLTEHGFHCACLHGDIKQEARTAVMQAFKSGRTPILIATDVAARGIDVDNVSIVYNYDIPQDYEYYIHRIGRTGRAGKEGISYTLAAGRRQVAQLRDIARFTHASIQPLSLPNTDDIRQQKIQHILDELNDELSHSSSQEINEILLRLLQKTSAEHLAESLLSLLIRREMNDVPHLVLPHSNSRKQGSPLPPVPDGYVRLRFSVGRYQRVAPNHITAAIADAARIPGKMIQKIYCYGEYSLVEVPSKFKNRIIKKVNGTKIGGVTTDVRVYSDGQSHDDSAENSPTSERIVPSAVPKRTKSAEHHVPKEPKEKALHSRKPDRRSTGSSKKRTPSETRRKHGGLSHSSRGQKKPRARVNQHKQ